MPYHDKRLTWLVIISSCFIFVAAGHGGGPILMLEVGRLINFHGGGFDFCFGLYCSYDQSLPFFMCCTFIGRIALLVANLAEKGRLRIIALAILCFGMIYLCRHLDTISWFTIILSFPFELLCIALVIKLWADGYAQRSK